MKYLTKLHQFWTQYNIQCESKNKINQSNNKWGPFFFFLPYLSSARSTWILRTHSLSLFLSNSLTRYMVNSQVQHCGYLCVVCWRTNYYYFSIYDIEQLIDKNGVIARWLLFILPTEIPHCLCRMFLFLPFHPLLKRRRRRWKKHELAFDLHHFLFWLANAIYLRDDLIELTSTSHI